MSSAVDWFLTTYNPPVTENTLDDAQAPFLADRAKHVRARERRRHPAVKIGRFVEFPQRKLH